MRTSAAFPNVVRALAAAGPDGILMETYSDPDAVARLLLNC